MRPWKASYPCRSPATELGCFESAALQDNATITHYTLYAAEDPFGSNRRRRARHKCCDEPGICFLLGHMMGIPAVVKV